MRYFIKCTICLAGLIFFGHSHRGLAQDTPAYKNALLPIPQRVEDLLGRMTLKEKVGQMNIPTCYSAEIGWGLDNTRMYMWEDPGKANRDKQLEGCRKWAAGTHNNVFGPGGGFFTLADRLIYEGPGRQAEVMNELQKIALEKTRLGIPLIQIEEGTHGLMCPGGTVFPEGLAIGATWNKELVRKIYTVAAREGRSVGIHGLCTLVMEVNRDARMGRNEEGFTEDPYMYAQIAGTMVQAIQGKNVAAPDKMVAFLTDFPTQSQPVSGLERGAVEVSERTLREVFLPPWTAGIKKYGALGVMAAYNTIGGEAVHSSEKMLTKLLREELGFEGIVLSEGGGIGTIVTEKHAADQKEAGAMAIKAGLDVGISIEDGYMGGLIANVNEGRVSMDLIDRAVSRILSLKFKMGLFEHPYVNVENALHTVHSTENKELALEASRESMVLLKNENNLLPLKKNLKSIAVIGPNANDSLNQVGDYYPHNIPQEIVTVLQGIKNKVSPETKINFVRGCDIIDNYREIDEIEQAKAAARKSSVAIVVLGEGRFPTKVGGEGGYLSTDGEGHDMANLDLTGRQEELLKAVYSTGTPTIVVLINGRALSIRWASANIPAILDAWLCGEQGGNAVADVLFGDYNPGGKLPVTFPRHSGQFPFYYNHSATKEDASYIDMPATPLYAFGHGLSYTKFEYSQLQINPKELNAGGSIEITCDIRNVGSRKGDEVPQLYLSKLLSTTSRPARELKGYERITLDPGQKRTVTFRLFPDDLAHLDRNMNAVVEPGTYSIMIGSSSQDARLKGDFNILK